MVHWLLATGAEQVEMLEGRLKEKEEELALLQEAFVRLDASMPGNFAWATTHARASTLLVLVNDLELNRDVPHLKGCMVCLVSHAIYISIGLRQPGNAS